MTIRRIRYLIFMKDVLIISISSFGGPQAHFALLLRRMVIKRGYLSEEDLIELNALCQLLPGPTSTQTITAIGYKVGGAKLAYITLLMWILPAFCIMTTIGIVMSFFDQMEISTEFTKYILPMAVGFVAYAAFIISSKVIKNYQGVGIMIISAMVGFMLRSPYAFPVLMIGGGLATAIKFNKHPIKDKRPVNVNWSNFILWAGVLIFVATLGHYTGLDHIRLFENFYRNGSLIFGGGQVLIPLLYTEFVEFKQFLTQDEFLTGYAAVQAVPGPVFSFTSYVGALSMREYGIAGEILGAFLATTGIFLPGTFFIFFTIKFWDQLKQYRIVRASLEGVSAASAGMVVAAAFILFEPIDATFINMAVIVSTFALLMYTRLPPPFIILAGLLSGFIF